MRNITLRLIGIIVLSVLVVGIIFAGGYQLNEHGARAVGMGGAFVARASDPSAIYFNPAGLAYQKGINVLGGFNLIMPSQKFKGDGINVPSTETSTNSQVFTPVNLYGTYQIDDQFVVGLGIFNPYGLGTEWPDNWVGKYLAVKTDIQTWYFNPSVGYKINDELSVGLGLSYIYGKVNMGYKVPTVASLIPLGGPYYAPNTAAAAVGAVDLEATASGFGVNFGAIYKPIEKLSIGFSFRSLTKLEFSGTAKFTDMLALAPYFPGGDGKATLPMPMNIYLGASYEVLPELTVEGDIQFVGWSAYKELAVNIPTGPLFPLPPQAGGPTAFQKAGAPAIKDWSDGYLLRAGGEYKYSDEIMLRGGLILDISPQPPSKTEPMLPDGDRIDISIGGSYKIDANFSVDAAYMLVLFMERDAKNSVLPGTYNSNAHIFSVNVGYTF